MSDLSSCGGRWVLVRDETVVARGHGDITVDTEAFPDAELRTIEERPDITDRIDSIIESAEKRSTSL